MLRQKCIIILVILSIFLLISCSSPAPQTIEVTRVVLQTVITTKIVEVIITATPVPPTSTPLPTSTPDVTATPTFIVWNSQQVVDAFKAAGLEVEDARTVTKDDYGMAPMTAIEGTHFIIPSLCSDCGGRIFSFATPEDLAAIKNYYDELRKSSALFFSWVFMKDNILVQINGDLSEATARQYEAALNNMK